MKKYLLLGLIFYGLGANRSDHERNLYRAFSIGATKGIILQSLLIKTFINNFIEDRLTKDMLLGAAIFSFAANELRFLLNSNAIIEEYNVESHDSMISYFCRGFGYGFTYNELLEPIFRTHNKSLFASPIKTNITFDSIIGAHEAKDELQTIITFLKNPQEYSRLGATISRGVLLEGNPGNGKTLLARAVATEAQCRFFTINGTDCLKKYVGEGEEYIKKLFEEARKQAPSIIFIDEIDTIGTYRHQKETNYQDTLLNQLLAEMDGFNQQDPKKPVIVIGATNRKELLDPALLRPGRFDRHIFVPLPDIKTREEIIAFYCKKITADPFLNINSIAKSTLGYSGAELKNLVNQATLLATKEGHSCVTLNHFNRARELITLGAVNTTTKMSDKEKRVTAYHEAGHALVYLLSKNASHTLNKVTILPRSKALGVTLGTLEEEKYSYSKEELFTQLQVCLGGRIAEEIEIGLISTGASNDFEKATQIAHSMVCTYGMSSLGIIMYSPDNKHFGFSGSTAEMIDKEIRSIINQAYKATYELLSNNKDKLKILAEALLEKETLDKEEIDKLLGL